MMVVPRGRERSRGGGGSGDDGTDGGGGGGGGGVGGGCDGGAVLVPRAEVPEPLPLGVVALDKVGVEHRVVRTHGGALDHAHAAARARRKEAHWQRPHARRLERRLQRSAVERR